jgi:hypothetical protein
MTADSHGHGLMRARAYHVAYGGAPQVMHYPPRTARQFARCATDRERYPATHPEWLILRTR